jgi:hypothetical protein
VQVIIWMHTAKAGRATPQGVALFMPPHFHDPNEITCLFQDRIPSLVKMQQYFPSFSIS